MAASGPLCSGSDFHDKFDPQIYLKQNLTMSRRRVPHFLRCYHDVFQSLPQCIKVLDYGSGPSILATISAASKASEIVLSDYTERNRDAINQWLKKDAEAIDWSPHFSYVVEKLEKKSKQEASERQEQVRRVVKAVVHCDIHQSPPIESDYNSQYDVVICSLVLEGTSSTRSEYKDDMAKLAALVKPGGLFLLYGIDRQGENGFYDVGDYRFKDISITAEYAMEAMRDAGCSDVIIDRNELHDQTDPNAAAFMFLKGTKSTLEL